MAGIFWWNGVRVSTVGVRILVVYGVTRYIDVVQGSTITKRWSRIGTAIHSTGSIAVFSEFDGSISIDVV